MARNSLWNNEREGNYREGTNLWSTKRAREAAGENKRKRREGRYDGVPEDSQFFKDKGKNNKGNKNNKRDDRRDQEQTNNKRKLGSRGSDPRSLSIADRQKPEETKVDKLEEQRNILNSFIEEYVKTAKSSGSIVDVIDDFLEDVCGILKDYYEPRYNDITQEMNECIEIMTTKSFMSSLFKAMDNDLIENWRSIWNDVARTLSIVLDTSHVKMQDETVSICVDDILASEFIWKMDIDKLMRKTGILKPLATQLVIGIPVLEEDFTDATLNLFAPKLLRIILDYAEENVDVLMKNTQYEIMTAFFGNEKVALKVIGKYLDANAQDQPDDETSSIILDEFYDMIYEFLDDYDIKEIEFVLSFLAKREKARIKECENRGIENTYIRVFDRKHTAEYPNIEKAVRNFDRNKPELSQYL